MSQSFPLLKYVRYTFYRPVLPIFFSCLMSHLQFLDPLLFLTLQSINCLTGMSEVSLLPGRCWLLLELHNSVKYMLLHYPWQGYLTSKDKFKQIVSCFSIFQNSCFKGFRCWKLTAFEKHQIKPIDPLIFFCCI